MFEIEAIRHAFEKTMGVECLDKPVDDFTYEELSDELQEKAFDFKKGAEFGYAKGKEEVMSEVRSVLERWYKQHSDEGYTETFYETLIEDTEKLLWADIAV